MKSLICSTEEKHCIAQKIYLKFKIKWAWCNHIKRLIYNKYFLWKGYIKMEGIIRIGTELYLLNYLYKNEMISEQEYYEIKKYINLV